MNVKVVSGSAAGFHINTVTYRESRSFFFTWRVAHGLSSVVKMLADSVWIITRTFSSNNDLCCFKTEQLLCPSLKGIPWRFPQNKKKKVFSPRNRPCVSFIHNKHAECFFIPSKKKRKSRHWKQQNTTSWTKMRVVGEFHPQVGKYWRFGLALESRCQPNASIFDFCSGCYCICTSMFANKLSASPVLFARASLLRMLPVNQWIDALLLVIVSINGCFHMSEPTPGCRGEILVSEALWRPFAGDPSVWRAKEVGRLGRYAFGFRPTFSSSLAFKRVASELH